ncbi:MAG: hypothetical protein QM713_13935 [Arachnia sp.]
MIEGTQAEASRDAADPKEMALAIWLERYRLQQAVYLARLDLRQRETGTAFVVVAAIGALMAGLINSKGLEGFLSHEAVLLVPFLSLLLATICFRIWVHDQRIEANRRYINGTILAEIAKLGGASLAASFGNSPDVSHGLLARNRNRLWRAFVDYFGRGVSLVTVATLISLFFTVLIVVQTLTSVGSLDNRTWAKIAYFAVTIIAWLLLMIVYIGYKPRESGEDGMLRINWWRVAISVSLTVAVLCEFTRQWNEARAG